MKLEIVKNNAMVFLADKPFMVINVGKPVLGESYHQFEGTFVECARFVQDNHPADLTDKMITALNAYDAPTFMGEPVLLEKVMNTPPKFEACPAEDSWNCKYCKDVGRCDLHSTKQTVTVMVENWRKCHPALAALWVDDATGAHLDEIGKRLGLKPRNPGQTDSNYRAALRFRVVNGEAPPAPQAFEAFMTACYEEAKRLGRERSRTVWDCDDHRFGLPQGVHELVSYLYLGTVYTFKRHDSKVKAMWNRDTQIVPDN